MGAINYYLNSGIPSLWNTIENHVDLKNGLELSLPHRKYEAETDGNSRAQNWFGPGALIKKSLCHHLLTPTLFFNAPARINF